MAFTVEDFSGLLRLLHEHPEWRAQLRAILLGEELLSLPQLLRELADEVRRLTEAHRRGEERLARLEEAQIRSEERLARLEEAQIRSEGRLARLEEAQIRSEERLARLEEAVLELARAQRTMQDDFGRRLELFQRNQDRFAQVVGATAEARMVPTVKRWLESRGLVVLDPILAWSLDGLTEFDGVTRAQGPQGVVWVLVSAEVRLQPGDVYDLANTLRRVEVRRRLEEEGVEAPVWPVVFGLTAERRVVQAAKELGVGLLLESQGEVVPPRPLEALAP